MGHSTVMGNSIREKVAQLRGLAVDPVTQSILAGEGSIFEEHAIPIEEMIIPDINQEIRNAATHVLTLSGLSAPGLPLYSVTGGVQRFQSFVTLNLAIAESGALVFDLPEWNAGSWEQFASANKVGKDALKETSSLLAAGAALADRVILVYRHSARNIGLTTAAEIITLAGLHIYDLSHILLDQLIEITRYHAALHSAQAYFEHQVARKVNPESWPSYI